MIPTLLLLLGSALGVFATFKELSASDQRTEEQSIQRGKLIGSQTSAVLEYIYRKTNTKNFAIEGASLVISQIGADPNLKVVVLLDEKNTILLANHFELQSLSINQTELANSLSLLEQVRQSLSGQTLLDRTTYKLIVAYPVLLDPKPGELRSSRVGVLLLRYDLSQMIRQSYTDAVWRSLQNSAILIPSCLLIGILFDRIITHRAAKLVAISQSFADGQLDHRVSLQGSDELAQIGRAFNNMAGQIKKNTEELQQSKNQLTQQAEQLGQALNELKQTQVKLIQTEKMSSLGRLVAGVAHEINNPTTFIGGNIEYTEQYIKDLLGLIQLYKQHYPNSIPEIKTAIESIELDFLMEDLPKTLASMRFGVERIHNIVLSLRNFSRLDESGIKLVDIHEGINSTLQVLQPYLRHSSGIDIQIKREYGNLPLIECYPGQLNQVFMNMFSNAIDAINLVPWKAERQVFEQLLRENNITCENKLDFKSILDPDIAFDRSKGRGHEQPTITIRTVLLNHDRIQIQIADNGMGMTDHTKEHLFEPFFTTKLVGQGTGLGLFTSYQIVVERHQGTLRCESQLGQGTQFRIEIPITQY
jgi:signal transduction histidine kinase